VLLAWFAARGSRAARVLLVAASLAGAVIGLFGSTSSWSTDTSVARVGFFACSTAQICLLVSTPMYQRTRPGRPPEQIPSGRFLPVPRLWMVAGSAAAGLLITAMPFWWGMRPFPCPAGQLPARSCLAHGTGYPIAYRFNLDIQNANGFRWLHVLAPRGIQAVALAADVTLWSLGVLLTTYLFWLAASREPATFQPWPAGPAGSPA